MKTYLLPVLLCAWGLMLAGDAQALTINITRGSEGALPIAVVRFGWEGATGTPAGNIAAIISDDLRRTGRFAPLPDSDLPGHPHDGSQVDFRDWRRLGTENLVVGRLKVQPDGGYLVQFQLFDVYKGEQITGYSIPTGSSDLRRTAHRISDIVYAELTGGKGAFTTHVAYITETKGGDKKKHYALHVADSDGFNPQEVLESTQPILSPAWSPDGKKLAYVSFEGKRPAIYIQNLFLGTREKVSAFEGLNGAPAWSPDGMRLALTLSKDGNPEIYIMDLRTQAVRMLTHNSAIDTEPHWAPDGKSLVFTSDRGGKPQIYRIPTDGGRARRLTFEGDYNARARLSPDGREMVMVHGSRGIFRIALMNLETGAVRELTDGRLDESPSFAPNGAMVIYAASDARGGALAAVSVDGRVHQRLTMQHAQVREPAWSPFME